jgi:hypothetical protein
MNVFGTKRVNKVHECHVVLCIFYTITQVAFANVLLVYYTALYDCVWCMEDPARINFY